MNIKTVIPLLIFMIFLSGCDYFPPYLDISKATAYNEDEDYEKAIIFYERALSKLSSKGLYKSIEYDVRYAFGVMLNDYTKLGKPDYIKVARDQFEWIRENPIKGEELIYARALSNLANTYQQEAGYVEGDDRYYQLLEQAYSTYEASIEEMAEKKDWKNVVYTYFNLGETAEWYGDYPTAIEWLEKAVKLNREQGFIENLAEDQAYLKHLKTTHEEMLNKSMQPTANASAD